jgi:predicted SprT family Zn-dependent metalloprotease
MVIYFEVTHIISMLILHRFAKGLAKHARPWKIIVMTIRRNREANGHGNKQKTRINDR